MPSVEPDVIEECILEWKPSKCPQARRQHANSTQKESGSQPRTFSLWGNENKCVCLIDGVASSVEPDCLQMVDFSTYFALRNESSVSPRLSFRFASAAVAAWTFLRHKNVMGIKDPWKIPIFGITSKDLLDSTSPLPPCSSQKLFSFPAPLPQKKTVARSQRYLLRGSAGISSCLWPYLHSVSDDNGEHVIRCPHGALHPPPPHCCLFELISECPSVCSLMPVLGTDGGKTWWVWKPLTHRHTHAPVQAPASTAERLVCVMNCR